MADGNYEQKLLLAQQQLEHQFPDMLSKHYGGLDIAYGWVKIVFAIMQTIKNHEDNLLRQRGPEYFGTEYHPVIVDQIKEKFGGLRFYYSGGDGYVDGLVTMAEQWAEQTCEICGERGELRKLGWMRTLCDEHYQGTRA